MSKKAANVIFETIGFIGLGQMGSQLVTRLINAGYTVLGYNRTKDKANSLIEVGMQWADSPVKLAEKCSVIFLSLSDDHAVDEIVEGKEGLLSTSLNDKLIIDMSTISPEISIKLANKIHASKGAMLDAPISGNPVMVKEGKATIMVGGDENYFTKAKPILESLCSNVFYVGKNGQALYLKLAININLAVQFHVLSESILLIKKAGLDLKNAIEIINHSAIASPGIQQRAQYILSPPAEQLFTIKLMQKDVLLALEQGRKLGIPLLNAAITNEALTSANGLGYGEKELSSLFKAMQQMLE